MRKIISCNVEVFFQTFCCGEVGEITPFSTLQLCPQDVENFIINYEKSLFPPDEEFLIIESSGSVTTNITKVTEDDNTNKDLTIDLTSDNPSVVNNSRDELTSQIIDKITEIGSEDISEKSDKKVLDGNTLYIPPVFLKELEEHNYILWSDEEYTKFLEKLNASKDLLTKTQDEYNELASQYNDLSLKLGFSESNVEKLEVDLINESQKVEDKKKEIKVLNQTIKDLKTENQGLKTIISGTPNIDIPRTEGTKPQKTISPSNPRQSTSTSQNRNFKVPKAVANTFQSMSTRKDSLFNLLDTPNRTRSTSQTSQDLTTDNSPTSPPTKRVKGNPNPRQRRAVQRPELSDEEYIEDVPQRRGRNRNRRN